MFIASAGGDQHIAHQTSDRHGSNAARNRGYRGRNLERFRECHISGKPHFAGRCDAVDADIDHNRARLDPVAAHHFGAPGRGDHDIGTAAQTAQSFGLGMCDCHRAVFLQ